MAVDSLRLFVYNASNRAVAVAVGGCSQIDL